MKQMTFYVPASENVISKIIDGEAVIINLSNGIYYAVEGVGATVWEGLLAGHGTDQLRHEVASRYDAASSGEDFDRLIGQFLDAELLKEVEASSHAEPQALEWPAAYSVPDFVTYDDVSDMVALDPPLPELRG